MRTLGLLLCLTLLGCTGGKPAMNRKIQVKPIAVPVPGGGTQMMESVAIEPHYKASAARLSVIPWRHNLPQGTVPNNYYWIQERSTDLKTWTPMYFVSETNNPIIQTDKPREFFRLVGHP